MYIFGGYDKTGFSNNDLFQFNFGKIKGMINKELNEWKEIKTTLKPPCRHLSHWISFNKSKYLIGGRNEENKIVNDVWVYSVEEAEWKELKLKLPKENVLGAYIHSNDICIIFKDDIISLNLNTLKTKNVKNNLSLSSNSPIKYFQKLFIFDGSKILNF
jgi:hypothetical protein